jgi:hypothetical protein
MKKQKLTQMISETDYISNCYGSSHEYKQIQTKLPYPNIVHILVYIYLFS